MKGDYNWWGSRSSQERPYHSDSTASRLLSEVKHYRARLVLRWGTTLESLVLFFCFFLIFHYLSRQQWLLRLRWDLFLASFVFPCSMVYFGINCNNPLWNSWCCSFASPLCTLSIIVRHCTCIANGCWAWDWIVLPFSFPCHSGLFECIANIICDLKYRLQMSSLPQPPYKYMQVAPSMPQRRSLQFVGGMVRRSNVEATSPSASWKFAIMGAAQKETTKEEFVQALIASYPLNLKVYW